MKKSLKRLFLAVRPEVAVVLIPDAFLVWLYRQIGSRLPIATRVFRKIGVVPVRGHYYELLFNKRHLSKPLNQPPALPGNDCNVYGQLELPEKENRADDFTALVEQQQADGSTASFRFNKLVSEPGDADFLYQANRRFRPGRFMEMGLRSFAKIARKAPAINAPEGGATPKHACVEPCEQPWLEAFGGIERVIGDVRFWSEQYLPEATPGNSARYHVIAALSMLKHEHLGELKAVGAFLKPSSQPGSFYFRTR